MKLIAILIENGMGKFQASQKSGFRQEEGGMQYGGEESITYNHSDGKKKVLIIHDTNKKQLEVSTFHRHE
jgi:hypothetical protein